MNLLGYISRQRELRFEWGVNDCLSLVGGWGRELGADPDALDRLATLEEDRRKFADWESFMARRGWRWFIWNLDECCERVSEPQEGDITLGVGSVLGIVGKGGTWAWRDGRVRLWRHNHRMAWRVVSCRR